MQHVRESKTVWDSGFHIPRHRLRIPGTGFRILCARNLDSGFQSLEGLRIPWDVYTVFQSLGFRIYSTTNICWIPDCCLARWNAIKNQTNTLNICLKLGYSRQSNTGVTTNSKQIINWLKGFSCRAWLCIACVEGVKRGRANLGAQGRKERNACRDAIVFSIFHAQILSVNMMIGQN